MKTTLLAILMLCSFGAQAASPSLVKKIIMCESSNRHVKNGRILCGDDGVSCGVAQFRKETFYEFAAMSKREGTWKLGKPNWFNEKQQRFLLPWGLNHGYGRRWTCYRILTAAPMDSSGRK